MKEEEIKEAGPNGIEAPSTKEFGLEGEASKASTKLLSITVKSHK